jgi:hypothetical protein
LLHQVGDLFEWNVKLRYQKVEREEEEEEEEEEEGLPLNKIPPKQQKRNGIEKC